MQHRIETGWHPDGSNQIKALCPNCETWFCAWVEDVTSWHAIRHAEREASAPFADFECFRLAVAAEVA